MVYYDYKPRTGTRACGRRMLEMLRENTLRRNPSSSTWRGETGEFDFHSVLRMVDRRFFAIDTDIDPTGRTAVITEAGKAARA